MTKILNNARIEARIPTQDLARARRWYAEKLGLELAEERDGGLRDEGATGVFCLFASAGVSDGSFILRATRRSRYHSPRRRARQGRPSGSYTSR